VSGGWFFWSREASHHPPPPPPPPATRTKLRDCPVRPSPYRLPPVLAHARTIVRFTFAFRVCYNGRSGTVWRNATPYRSSVPPLAPNMRSERRASGGGPLRQHVDFRRMRYLLADAGWQRRQLADRKPQ
jgi:hypothetical protein